MNYARLIDLGSIRSLCNSTRWTGAGWLVLALFFSYMAFDDGVESDERVGSSFAMLQERLGAAQSATTGSRLLDAFPSYPWQVIFLPAFGGMGLFMLVFLWREFGSCGPRSLLLAGLGCFVFAVGLDFVEGLDEDHVLNLYTGIASGQGVDEYTTAHFGHEAFDTVRHFGKSLEEKLEMLGSPNSTRRHPPSADSGF